VVRRDGAVGVLDPDRKRLVNASPPCSESSFKCFELRLSIVRKGVLERWWLTVGNRSDVFEPDCGVTLALPWYF
jgi:hypothetical protein